MRSPFANLVLLAPLALAVSTSAAASPLTAYGYHVGEDHSFDDHHAQDLHHIDLCLADLTASDFGVTNLRSGLFVDAVLVGLLLDAAELEAADFSGADLTGADLSGADAEAAIFAHAVLEDAVLLGADLEDADFTGASLLGADLSTVVNGDLASFAGAYYDAATLLDPAIDTSGMYRVMSACPSDPELWWVDTNADGEPDECHEPVRLPEPGSAALLAGIAMLAGFRAAIRRRAKSNG